MNSKALIGGIILTVIATVLAIQLTPTMITSWVTTSNTSGLTAAAQDMTEVGQLVSVVLPVVVALGGIFVTLKVAKG